MAETSEAPDVRYSAWGLRVVLERTRHTAYDFQHLGFKALFKGGWGPFRISGAGPMSIL